MSLVSKGIYAPSSEDKDDKSGFVVDDGVNTLILVMVELILTVGGNPKEALDKVSLGLDKLANKYLKMALLRFLFELQLHLCLY